MTAITLSTGALRAALLYAGDRDVRDYLNGIHLLPRPSGIYLEATDGHRMIQIRGACDGHVTAPVILHRDELERACKLAGKTTTVALSIDGSDASITVAGITVPQTIVAGTFPDAALYFEPGTAVDPLAGLSFNGDYLADIGKTAKALGLKYSTVRLDGERNGALYASIAAQGIRAGIVLMGIRVDDTDADARGYWHAEALERAA